MNRESNLSSSFKNMSIASVNIAYQPMKYNSFMMGTPLNIFEKHKDGIQNHMRMTVKA